MNYVNKNAPKGGSLRLSAVGTFSTLNPHSVLGASPYGLMTMCFDSLMYRSPKEPFSLYPMICEKVDIAKDFSSVTFFINPKAIFHNGDPITAKDVQFTFEKLRDEGLPRYKQFYGSIEKFEIINDKILKLTLSKRGDGVFDPELPLVLCLLRPLSEKYTKDIDFMNAYQNSLIGSGPYKVGSINLGQKIVYHRVKNYWAQDLECNQGQNNFDVIDITYFKNPITELQALINNDIDMIFETDPMRWEESYPQNNSSLVKVNMEHQRPVAVKTIIMNMNKKIFHNIKVRKALCLAFDFDGMNRVIFKGRMKQPFSLFENTSLAHTGPMSLKESKILDKNKCYIDPTIWANMKSGSFSIPKDHKNNLTEAAKLLKEAGCVFNNGVLYQKDGSIFSIELMIKDPRFTKICLFYRQSLKKIGIDLKVTLIDQNQYETRVVERDFDMIIHTWLNSLSPGNEQIYYFSRASADMKGSSNYMGLKDAVAEESAKHVPSAQNYDDLTTYIHALDRYLMYQYLQIPLSYDNEFRMAYYSQKIAFPPITKNVGLDSMRYAWAVQQSSAPAKTDKKKDKSQSQSWLHRLKKLLGF
jgi:microcin C transport system substrate-binding protein